MNQQSQAASDLAFMRALAEDKDPLPAMFGAHLILPAVVFAPGPLIAWAAIRGYVSFIPAFWTEWLWVLCTLIYLPIMFYMMHRDKSVGLGPNRRAFGAAWSAMGAMTFTLLFCLYFASVQTNTHFMGLWPCIAFAMYGGAWMVIAAMRQQLWHWLVAVGCFLTAVFCAVLVNSPEEWLVMGLGLFAWLGGPGVVIVLKARSAAKA